MGIKEYYTKKRFSILLFILSNFLLFHTHYIYCVPLFLTVVLHCSIYHHKEFMNVVKACAVSLIILLPWIIWFLGVKYGHAYNNLFDLKTFGSNLNSFLLQINRSIFPGYLLLLPLLVTLFIWIREKRFIFRYSENLSADSLILLFILTTIFTLSSTAPLPFYRYLNTIIPFLMIIIGRIIIMVGGIHYCVSFIVLISFLIFQPVPDFLYELTHNYNGPIKGIVKYLNNHAKPEDMVVITYGDMPLKFYTNLRIIGGLTGEDLSLAKKARWIIIRRDTNCLRDAAVKEYLGKNIDFSKYRFIKINYPDIPYENRETPFEHRYRTVTGVPSVLIIERMQ